MTDSLATTTDATDDLLALRDELLTLGAEAGLAAVGVCEATPFEETRQVLEERRAQGLNGEMAFTYRNPERSTDPSRTLRDAKSMVVAAYRYDTTLAESPAGSDDGTPYGRVARYATEDHYDRLRQALRVMAELLKKRGHRAIVVADDNAMVDRAAAVRAGLGWYGKSANVLLPGRGSWFVLGSLITDLALPPTGARVDDGCGACRRCIDGCPTAAIVAPGVVDARRCLSWLLQAPGDFPREFRTALGDRIYGCDDCQEVCPPSVRADRRGIDAPDRADTTRGAAMGGGWVDIEWMLNATDEELLDKLGTWYIPRRDPRYLRRNALVVYGNTAAGNPPERIRALLGRFLDGDDDMLASHAAWAAVRLGESAILATRRRHERDVIRDELELSSWET